MTSSVNDQLFIAPPPPLDPKSEKNVNQPIKNVWPYLLESLITTQCCHQSGPTKGVARK